MQLEILRLPTTPLMLENACFLMQGESVTAWPLVCDPTSRIIEWLRFRMKDKGLVEVRYTVSMVSKYNLIIIYMKAHTDGIIFCYS